VTRGGRRRGRERGTEGPVEVGALVADMLDRSGLRAQVDRIGVLDAWPSLVGPTIAAVARASGISNGTLFVEVSSSPWLMELNGKRHKLLKLVNRSVPDVPFSRIVFRLSGRGEASAATSKSQRQASARGVKHHDR